MQNVMSDFMDYYDFIEDSYTYEIADEGFIEAMIAVKNALVSRIKKLRSFNQNVLANANYFKDCRLDPQENQDLIQVLRISQPRTDINFKPIAKYYESMKKSKDGTKSSHTLSVATGGDYHSTTLLHEVERSTVDIYESLKAARNSEAYKRLKSNKYSKSKKFEPIPLGIIIQDLKHSNEKLAYFEAELSKMDSVLKRDAKSPGAANMTKRMEVFFHKVVEYYSFRIGVIQMFLKRAKSTNSSGVYNRNMNVHEDESNRTKSSTKRKGIAVSVQMKTPEQIEKIRDLYERAKKAPSYKEYKPLYDELSTMLNCKGKNIEALKIVGLTVNMVVAGDSTPVKVPIGGRPLYHNSDNPNIKVLEGRYVNKTGVLFPEPRVYFHIGFSTDRYGAKNSSDATIYTPIPKFDIGYRDAEMGRTSIYVVADIVPVKKVNFEQKKNDTLKEIDLDFENHKNKR